MPPAAETDAPFSLVYVNCCVFLFSIGTHMYISRNVLHPDGVTAGVSCSPGDRADSTVGVFPDRYGRLFSGHWVVKPGYAENRTLVTEQGYKIAEAARSSSARADRVRRSTGST